MLEPDRRALAEAGERRDEQSLHAERGPVALRVLDQLVGLADPDGAAPALEPVVEQDAGDLAALAGAGAVAEKPSASKADGVLCIVTRGGDEVEGFIDRPRAGEELAMSLAGIDDAFELGVRQHAVSDEVRRQVRPIGRLGRRNRGHRRRLHEPRRMRLRAGNTDRLQSVFFIKRIREAGAVRGRPVDSLIGELHGLRFGERRTAGRTHREGADRSGNCRSRGIGNDDGRGERQARRDMLVHPGEQSRRVRSYSWRGRKDLRIGGGFLVDDGEPRLDRGAVLGIDGAIDSGGENDTAALLKPDESVAPGRIVRREV